MRKMKVILALLLVIFVNQVLATFPATPAAVAEFVPPEQATINPATASNTSDNGDPTKGEIGWLGTMAGVYNKSREAVKSVYDEIQYWKGLGATYGMMKDWFSNQKEKFKAIRRTIGRLGDDGAFVFKNLEGKDWFETMLNYMESPLNYANFYINPLESTFDQTDGVVYGGFSEMDRIFSHAERYMNLIGDSKISGLLMPNTDEIYDKFDEIIYTSPYVTDEWKERIISDKNYKKFTMQGDTSKITPLKDDELAQEHNRQIELQEDFFSKNNDKLTSVADFPETKIVEMMKALTASATGNSAMYYDWAVEGLEILQKDMKDVDKLFADNKMDNILDLQILAAKFEIEMINANNKRILHSLEALKIHHAMLGFEIWKHNEKKSFDESIISEALTLQMMMQEKATDFNNKKIAREQEEKERKKQQEQKDNSGDNL